MSKDATLKQAVLDQLSWEPSVNAAHIGVTANAGIITLMGHVETYAQKSAAERAVRRVADVKAVVEELEVRLPLGVDHGDADIAAAAVNRMLWDSAIPANAVQAKVEAGWITLTGQVDWRYQHDAAADDVRSLWGVIGVSNNITVKPRPNTTRIHDDIVAAMDRAWFDPANITVVAQGGKVRLTGSVESWAERDEASATAWAAPGTTMVDNDLMVV